MPLIKSPTKKAFSKNVSKEVKAGKPVKQAVAIAYSEKEKSKGPQMKWAKDKKPKEIKTDRGSFGFKGK